MTSEQRQNRTVIGFLLLSMLLHMLLLLLPKERLFPRPPAPAPVYVEVRPTQPRDRELDLPLREELEKPRETPAKRLAERNQVVEQEMAPEGQDSEDRQQMSRTEKPAQQPPPSVSTPPKEPSTARSEPAPPRPSTPDGWLARPEPKPKIR